jgi:hypothetical protein
VTNAWVLAIAGEHATLANPTQLQRFLPAVHVAAKTLGDRTEQRLVGQVMLDPHELEAFQFLTPVQAIRRQFGETESAREHIASENRTAISAVHRVFILAVARKDRYSQKGGESLDICARNIV